MSQPFRIIICGAGIAGLSAGIGLARLGHEIVILESAHKLSPAGVGIHVPPNATLVLDRWGFLEKFSRVAITPAGFKFRRYADGSVLAQSGQQKPENALKTPYWSMRRCDYQEILYEVALQVGCQVRLGQKVDSVNENTPSVTIVDGEELKADLIIVADGIKSALRHCIVPEEDSSPVLQPLSTFRAWAPTVSLLEDPLIAPLLKQPATNIWMGPSRHMIIYPAENGSIYTINGTYPARNDPAAAWNEPASIEQIQSRFQDFDPAASQFLGKVRDCTAWALAEVPRLPRWTSKSGKVTMMGDAAHGMLQFLAQGAAMAIEDAAALAECVGRAQSNKDIPAAMLVFERSRKWRCERVQTQARRNGEALHMPDGEEQEHRDRMMAGKSLPSDQEVESSPMLDPKFTSWLYGHDVFEHTKRHLDTAGL